MPEALGAGLGDAVVPGLLIPVVASYFADFRPDPRTALRIMIAGPTLSVAWLLAGWVFHGPESGTAFLGIEPMFPGLFLAIIVWGWGRTQKGHGAAAVSL